MSLASEGVVGVSISQSYDLHLLVEHVLVEFVCDPGVHQGGNQSRPSPGRAFRAYGSRWCPQGIGVTMVKVIMDCEQELPLRRNPLISPSGTRTPSGILNHLLDPPNGPFSFSQRVTNSLALYGVEPGQRTSYSQKR